MIFWVRVETWKLWIFFPFLFHSYHMLLARKRSLFIYLFFGWFMHLTLQTIWVFVVLLHLMGYIISFYCFLIASRITVVSWDNNLKVATIRSVNIYNPLAIWGISVINLPSRSGESHLRLTVLLHWNFSRIFSLLEGYLDLPHNIVRIIWRPS